MPPRSAFGVLVVTLLMSPDTRAENAAEKKVELKSGDRIMFFGDSLTYLAGKEEPKDRVTKRMRQNW
jgi:hypothetical protein